MKRISILLLLLSLISGITYAQKEKKEKKKKKGKGETEATLPVTPPKPQLKNYLDSVSYSIGVNIGSSVNSQPIDSLNTELLLQGLRSVLEKKDTLLLSEMQSVGILQSYFQSMRQKMEEKNKQKAVENKKMADDFLAANKTKPGVVTTGTGLQYIVQKEGTGPYPKPTDRVKVHYTGTFLDGKKFDSSVDRGEPAVFGVQQVIKGWTEALQMMKVGSKWKVFISPELGYGDQGRGAEMPPNSLLIFEVELLGIEK
ncbi:FKBP-type peptidyl-prolyl cis-trans isomerase [Cytophagaceae bacterium DM2B3-1]|uniref:Peptidyl-prolyl cis-trans isomerase n=1 Tax=Xanthocytophaga flava TaxID=3048013 RepID=A0ABT7CVK7_9BACT|nr:FKBP-type peptidyl-prolyl cis-trans isomerase [Xanthocytophaga flavus]MDJ1472474.1 FKBP-type peptidyl-prolyl cis-trans isomerase [Xanthocytophaga flavus]MDJ1497804.1 FKBP-type peptidyl-prolyl cis-trans isomerase [Xanthocytophaga flavus]